MIRKIVKINEEKCNGCGLCITGCHEGALQLVNGKAKLISESYCDGLGACLPECPTGAITIEEREAEAFDEAAVEAKMKGIKGDAAVAHGTAHAAATDAQATATNTQATANIHAAAHEHNMPGNMACGCPGSRARFMDRSQKAAAPAQAQGAQQAQPVESQLRQWPCQIKLISPNAPYLNNAHLLIAADCTAYAYANIHNEFMRNKITLIGCPKLDDTDYSDKLAAILMYNDIKSITVLRMEVPCCGGIVAAVKNALLKSKKMIPWSVTTISTDGNILDV